MRCDARDPPTLSNQPTNHRRGEDGSVGGAERGVVWGSIEGGWLVNLRQLPAVPVMQRLRPDGTTGWKLHTVCMDVHGTNGHAERRFHWHFRSLRAVDRGHLHYLLRKLEAGKRALANAPGGHPLPYWVEGCCGWNPSEIQTA